MNGSKADETPSTAQQAPQIGSRNFENTHQANSEVNQINTPEHESSPTFRAVYTGFDEDMEVELVERVPASESDHQFGHAVIDRPDWDETKTALLQNLRVDVLDDDKKEETDG